MNKNLLFLLCTVITANAAESAKKEDAPKTLKKEESELKNTSTAKKPNSDMIGSNALEFMSSKIKEAQDLIDKMESKVDDVESDLDDKEAEDHIENGDEELSAINAQFNSMKKRIIEFETLLKKISANVQQSGKNGSNVVGSMVSGSLSSIPILGALLAGGNKDSKSSNAAQTNSRFDIMQLKEVVNNLNNSLEKLEETPEEL